MSDTLNWLLRGICIALLIVAIAPVVGIVGITIYGASLPVSPTVPEFTRSEPYPERVAIITGNDAFGCIDSRDTGRIWVVAAPDPRWMKSVFAEGECVKLRAGERVTVIAEHRGGAFYRARRAGSYRAYWVPISNVESERAP